MSAKLRTLQAVEAELTTTVVSHQHALWAAQAQEDEDATETALVRLTVSLAARTCARQHLERLGYPIGPPPNTVPLHRRAG